MTVSTPPRPPRRQDPDALIEEAWQRTRQRRRRRLRLALLAALFVALAAAVTIRIAGGGLISGGGGSSSGAAARGVSSPGRYWYTRTIVPAGAPVIGIAVPSAHAIVETWIGTDGTWRQRLTVPSDPGEASDTIIGGDGLFPPQANATGSTNGVPFNPRDPGDGLFTYRQLQLLPTSTVALRSRIARAVVAQTERDLNAYVLPSRNHRQIVARLRPRYFGGPAGRLQQTLIAISDLEASPLPNRVRAALFRVAESLPGVRVTAGAHDRLGRSGVAVMAGDALPLIFDPRTGSLLAGVAGVVVADGPVDSITATPAHVASINEPAGLQPLGLTVAPPSGNRATTFTAHLTVSGTLTRSARAPFLAADIFGPTGPGCFYWMSRPPFVRIPSGTTTTRGTVITRTFRLSPAVVNRRDWCPGRYQLVISPISPSAIGAAGATARERAHAAAYFTAG
ncbi:MAG TPA: hypothetical protein VMA77_25705 [Solirubrobacteraceae bacterium]|nr:hypothetical protein [Solirubrobacteraceae bacterium]